MRPDPFYLKRYSKWNPKRLFPTLQARIDNRLSITRFAAYELPLKPVSVLPPLPYEPDLMNTALGQTDLQYLLWACQICDAKQISGVCVEVGCFRGITTRFLARIMHPRPVFAVDPFRGYGGDESDYELFCRNTQGLDNVQHLRLSSGDAFRGWQNGPVAFVFIDAVHDYPNTRFDLEAWGSLLSPGGIIAAHDTDNRGFAGTRRAVFEATQRGYDILAHPSNLTILSKPNNL